MNIENKIISKLNSDFYVAVNDLYQINYIISLANKVNEHPTILQILKNKKYHLIRKLLINGLDPHYSQLLLMRHAIYTSDLILFKILITQGFDIKKYEGWILAYSVEFSPRVLKLLLDSGADINKILKYTDYFINNSFDLSKLLLFGIDEFKLDYIVLITVLDKCSVKELYIVLSVIESIKFVTINDNQLNKFYECGHIIETLNKFKFSSNQNLHISSILNKIFHTKFKNLYTLSKLKQFRKLFLFKVMKLIIWKSEEPKQFRSVFTKNLISSHHVTFFASKFKKFSFEMNLSEFEIAKIIAYDSILIFNILEELFHISDENKLILFKLANNYGSINFVKNYCQDNNFIASTRYLILLAIKFNYLNLIKFYSTHFEKLVFANKSIILTTMASHGTPQTLIFLESYLKLNKGDVIRLLTYSCFKMNFKLTNFIRNKYLCD